MNRRELISSSTVLAGLAVATDVLAQARKPDAKTKGTDATSNPHAGHMGSTAPTAAAPGPSAVVAAFAAAAQGCVTQGEICQAHCIRTLSAGDTSMAACARSVTEMLAVCRAVTSLANLDSKHLKALAAVCIATCTDCEAACKEHAAHHAECKACMEACAETIKAARALG